MSLTVTGPGGSNTQTRSNYVTVDHRRTGGAVHRQPRPPATSPLMVNFSNTSTGSITSYAWTFGDGGTSTLAAPSHSYAAAGIYTVSLTVTGPGGSNTQTRSNYVTVDHRRTGGAVHRQPRLRDLPADGQLQQHLDRQHHQLRLDLR